MVVTSAESRFKTFNQMIDEARSKPGMVSMATYSISYRVAAARLAKATGVTFNPVAYKGAGNLAPDLIANVIDVSIMEAGAALPFLKSGKLRALASTGATPHAELRSVPTVKELGLPELEYNIWIGVFVRSETPKPIVERLEKEIGAIVRSEEFSRFVRSQSATSEAIGLTGQPAVDLFAKESNFYQKQIRSLGLEPQ